MSRETIADLARQMDEAVQAGHTADGQRPDDPYWTRQGGWWVRTWTEAGVMHRAMRPVGGGPCPN